MNYNEFNKGCFEEAKRLYKTANADQRYVLEKLFPELAESEDERIRKGIFKALSKKDARDVLISQGIEVSDALNWLEKHENRTCKEKDDSSVNEDDIIRKNCIHFLELQKSHHAATFEIDECIAWLEKQGEQEKDILEDCIILNSNEDGLIAETIRYKHEKQAEQNQTNKVEPKFKVGDWVVDKNGIVKQILSYKHGVYKHTYGYSGKILEDGWRLWDITKDAKGGDVLCNYNEAYNNPLIFILKKFEHVNFGLVRPSDYSSYCFLTAGDIQRFKEGTYHHEHNIKPATKEQHDLLFQKMHEAGYEWDAENKELVKIKNDDDKLREAICE